MLYVRTLLQSPKYLCMKALFLSSVCHRSKLSLSNGEPGSRKDSWLALCNALPTIKTPKVKETSEVTTKPKLSRMYPSTKYTKTMEQIRHQKKLTVSKAYLNDLV